MITRTTDNGQRTWADICAGTDKNPDSVGRTFRRTFPDRKWRRTAVPLPDELSAIIGQPDTDSRSAIQTPQDKRDSSFSVTEPTPSPNPGNIKSGVAGPKFRRGFLYLLMAIPAGASIQNMYHVSFDIVEQMIAAALFTGLFSAAPFLFVLAGIRAGWTKALVVILIAYECFCNFTRIFGGLTGYERGGNPTRFLGLVTDVFQSGTHQTGIAVAAIMAAMAALVFYAAFNEIGK